MNSITTIGHNSGNVFENLSQYFKDRVWWILTNDEFADIAGKFKSWRNSGNIHMFLLFYAPKYCDCLL